MVELTAEQKQQIDKIRYVMQDKAKLENYIEGYKERKYMEMTNAYEREKEAEEVYLKAYYYCQQHPETVTLQERTEVLKSHLEYIRNNGKKRGYITNRASVKSSFHIYEGMTLNISEEDMAKARQSVINETELSLQLAIDKYLKILNIYERRERLGLLTEERKALINKKPVQQKRR